MPGMKRGVADPMRSSRFGHPRHPLSQFFCDGVFESPARPFCAASDAVFAEGVLISSPHIRGGVVAPTFLRGVCEDVDELQHFHPLLAKTLVVENANRLFERWKWQECVHLPGCYLLMPFATFSFASSISSIAFNLFTRSSKSTCLRGA